MCTAALQTLRWRPGPWHKRETPNLRIGPMKKRTQLLLPTLILPFLFAAGVTACGDGGNPSGGGTGGNATTGTGGTGSLGTGGNGSPGTGGNGNVTGGGGGAQVGSGGSDTTGAGGGTDTGTGGTSPTDPTVLTVQLGEVRQIIRGFGLNATIMDGQPTPPWDQLYTLEGDNALGLSILRIGMDENGGHRGVPSSWETVKDLGARVIGSCWSAPSAWKTNNKTTNGGFLLPDRYDDWAKMIAKYANDNGLYAMSIGNETDFASCSSSGGTCTAPLTDEYESMVYTGKQLAEFVKVAGPIFDTDAPNTKMIAPEASLWIHVWSNLSPTGVGVAGGGYESSDPLNCGCFSNTIDPAVAATCAAKCTDPDPSPDPTMNEGGYDYGHWLAKDPAAWSAFDIMGVHEYESQVAYAWPSDVTGGVRDKEVWQTEMSGVMYWPEQGPSTDIKNGVAVARWVHSALTVGEASAWLYWWYQAYYQDDNEGLALTKGGSTIAKRYYALGNFSRYIRPDVFHAVRVAGPSPAKVLVSAYKGDAGEVVIVAINETEAAVEVPIAITGGTAPATMVPHVTSAAGNWVAGTAVAVTAGSLPASLPAMSITTFVSN